MSQTEFFTHMSRHTVQNIATWSHKYPSGLRPDRRGRERFVDREHSVTELSGTSGRLSFDRKVCVFVGCLLALRCQRMTKEAIC